MLKLNNVRYDLPDRFSELDFFKRNFSRIINIYEGNILPPYEILIHPSSFCNLSCKWCIGAYVSRDKNKEKIIPTRLNNIKNMQKVINGIINYKKNGKDYLTDGKNKLFKVENVSFSGITGEPFIAKDALLFAIEKLKENNIRVGIFTNGTLIEDDMLETITKMDYILISIDAGDENTYNTEKGCNPNDNIYNKVLDNIKKINKYKIEHNRNIDINIGYIINQYNYSQIYELAKKLKSIGIHYFRLKTDISSKLILNNQQNKDVERQIDRVKKELEDDYFTIVQIHKLNDEKQKIRDFKKCYIHYLYAAISADGNVYPCNYHPRKNGYYYDSAIEKNFSTIWENLNKYEIDSKIPDICPDRCDPFKTRANRMLEQCYLIYKEKGIEELKKIIFGDEMNENA